MPTDLKFTYTIRPKNPNLPIAIPTTGNYERGTAGWVSSWLVEVEFPNWKKWRKIA